jgi:hypothetical protein
MSVNFSSIAQDDTRLKPTLDQCSQICEHKPHKKKAADARNNHCIFSRGQWRGAILGVV